MSYECHTLLIQLLLVYLTAVYTTWTLQPARSSGAFEGVCCAKCQTVWALRDQSLTLSCPPHYFPCLLGRCLLAPLSLASLLPFITAPESRAFDPIASQYGEGGCVLEIGHVLRICYK
jgi:hypothetical protein